MENNHLTYGKRFESVALTIGFIFSACVQPQQLCYIPGSALVSFCRPLWSRGISRRFLLYAMEIQKVNKQLTIGKNIFHHVKVSKMRRAQNVNLQSVPTHYALKCLPIYHLKFVLCNFLPQAPSRHNPDFPRHQKPQHQAHRAVLEPLACWDLTRDSHRCWGELTCLLQCLAMPRPSLQLKIRHKGCVWCAVSVSAVLFLKLVV